ncbi:putative RNA helicase [Medicago truncatula]|uniref:Putative RNA helicase n=1 Tax=Medicago truncatula TaxID=3880 RepID=A0A396JBF1_MEDTR|nr:putative RNA helicase [Medicago truncatula]
MVKNSTVVLSLQVYTFLLLLSIALNFFILLSCSFSLDFCAFLLLLCSTMDSNLDDIDAIWFQKKVSEIFGNNKVDELLNVLGGDYDDMEAKNRLLLCMKNEASHFINFLLRNRFKISLTKVIKNLSLEASAATPTDSSSEEDYNIVMISTMPDWAQPAFKGMTHLNRVQSKVYKTALFNHDNLLLCAPTGAGKDIVAVLTILQQIALHRNPYNGYIDHSAYKILYMTHSEAVVKLVRMLRKTFEDYGIKVGELSEDPSVTWEQIEESQIMVTTPEK